MIQGLGGVLLLLGGGGVCGEVAGCMAGAGPLDKVFRQVIFVSINQSISCPGA